MTRKAWALCVLCMLILCGASFADGLETFDDFPGHSSYGDGTFTGQDGSTWTYVETRGDLELNGSAATIGKAHAAYVRSGVIAGGLGTLQLNYRHVSNPPLRCSIYVNGEKIGEIDGKPNGVQTWTSGEVNVAGDVVLTISNRINSGRIAVDDMSWTGFKEAASVTLGDLEQVYDGSPRNASVETEPAGLTVQVTYDGSAAVPTAAGTYAVVATIGDPIYEGAATGTLTIAKAPVQIELENLEQVYDGTPRTVQALTSPEELPVEMTYDDMNAPPVPDPFGEPGVDDIIMETIPTDAGEYEVLAWVDDLNYEGSATGQLIVAKADQEIDFPEIGEVLESDVVALSAMAGSGLNVAFDVESGPAVLTDEGLTFTDTGTVSVVASQAGDDNWNAAEAVTRSFTVKGDGLSLEFSTTNVNVHEEGEGRFFVRLSHAPTSRVTVAVACVDGGGDLSIKSGSSLDFKPTSWNFWQPVTLQAAKDGNALNETATLRISGLGMQTQSVVATVLDTDIGENLALSSVVTGRRGYRSDHVADGIHSNSANYAFTTWGSVPPGTLTMDLQTTATVSRVRLLTWDWTYRQHQYTIESSPDGLTWSMLADAGTGAHLGWEDWPVADGQIRYLRFTGLTNSVNSAVCLPELEVYGTQLQQPAIVLSKSEVNVREGGEGRLFVRLDSQPVANVLVTVGRIAGDESLSVESGACLTFKPSNWSIWQCVTLVQDEDSNADDETATFGVSLPGAEACSVTVTALDDDIGENLALSSGGATLSGSKAYFLTHVNDGEHTDGYHHGYTIWTNEPPGTMTLDLQDAMTVFRVRLLNWDWTYRTHQYVIEASVDGENWWVLADAGTGEHQGWEDWAVEDEAIRYLRFTGLSNSANTAVCIPEWEVYGARPVARAATAQVAEAGISLPDEECDFAYAQPVPISVLTSDGPEDETGWNAVDGDETTAWIGQSAGGGYIVVEYGPNLILDSLVVDVTGDSLANAEFLYSLDAEEWLPLPEPEVLESEPVELKYLWVIFPDDGSGTLPGVIEILPNP